MGYMKQLDIRIRNGGDDAIAAVSELMPRWIPVTERLPPPPASEWEDSVAVLAWSKNKGRGIAHYIVDKDYGNRWSWERVGEPTHWMPLPAPPSETGH